jgi:hypothetical protein
LTDFKAEMTMEPATMPTANDDNAHGRLIDLLTEASQRAGKEGVTKQDVLPAVADFLASLALIMAGEEGTRAVITRLEQRIEDWKAGTFPAPDIIH